MKPGRLREVTAAIWLGIGVINGASALNHSNEAVRAEATAQTYEAQGNTSQAAQLESYADSQKDDRNRFLFLVATDLGVAAITGVAAAVSISASRRRKQEEAPTQE